MQLMNINNGLTMSSREIAELTGKQHKHVKRDIEVMLDGLGVNAPKFGHIYFDSRNREQTEYRLPKDETLCLLAGYDAKARMAIIKRWQELESKQAPMTLEQLLEHNTRMIQDLRNNVIQLEQKIEQDKPLTEFGRTVSESATAVKIGDWAKAMCDDGYKIGQNRAFEWMRKNGYLMDKKKNMPYQRYIDQGLFEVKEALVATPTGQKITFTTLLTGKGQVYFANKAKHIEG